MVFEILLFGSSSIFALYLLLSLYRHFNPRMGFQIVHVGVSKYKVRHRNFIYDGVNLKIPSWQNWDKSDYLREISRNHIEDDWFEFHAQVLKSVDEAEEFIERFKSQSK